MENNLEKSGYFETVGGIGKIQTVLRPSGKWEVIWRNPDKLSGFSVIRAKLSGEQSLRGVIQELLTSCSRLIDILNRQSRWASLMAGVKSRC